MCSLSVNTLFAAMGDIGYNEHATRSKFTKFYSYSSFYLFISVYTNKERIIMLKTITYEAPVCQKPLTTAKANRHTNTNETWNVHTDWLTKTFGERKILLNLFASDFEIHSLTGKQFVYCKTYRGANMSLARPGRKQATTTEDSDFHKSYL
jgi:hypothetical protein